jgi:hypothetical protein
MKPNADKVSMIHTFSIITSTPSATCRNATALPRTRPSGLAGLAGVLTAWMTSKHDSMHVIARHVVCPNLRCPIRFSDCRPKGSAPMAALATQISWQTLEEAKQNAARQKKPILLDFSAAPT